MPARFPVSVLPAEGQLYSAEVEFVVVPAAEGELGILDRHEPVLALLKAGPLRVSPGGIGADDEDVLFVSGGFSAVGRDDEDKTGATAFAATRERAHDSDAPRAR